MSDTNTPEPTMEEILASIRRIISEDEPVADATPVHTPEPEPAPVVHAPDPEPEPVAAEHDDVLELTQIAPEPEPAPLETHGDIEVHSAPTPAPAPAPAPVLAPVAEDEPLMSHTTANSAASSFGQLAQTVAMPKQGQLLEDVVRELLRPLLKEWLDQHLPGIVQAKVEEEVERIARRRLG
jgi:uncharacterized protein